MTEHTTPTRRPEPVKVAFSAPETDGRPKRKVVTGESPLPIPDELCWVLVDGGTAAAWLEHNQGNRPRQEAAIAGMVRDMIGGHFYRTGHSIIFGPAPRKRLLNGQKTLTAIVEANRIAAQVGKDPIAVELVVVPDVPEPSQRVMDTGEPRLLKQTLEMQGMSFPDALAGAIKLCMYYDRNGLRDTRAPFTSEECLFWLSRNPDLKQAVAEVAQYRKLPMPKRVLALCQWRLRRAAADHVDVFMGDLMAGRGTGYGDPRQVLLRTLAEHQFEGRRVPPAEQVALVFTAWNHWRRNELDVPKLRLDLRPDPTNARKAILVLPDPL